MSFGGGTPQCTTDFLWWAFLAVLGVAWSLTFLLLKKGILERLDSIVAEQKEARESQNKFQTDCFHTQQANRELYASRPEFETLLKVRIEDHRVINGRLGSLESGQRDIANQISTFHGDFTEKMKRLSLSFFVRDASITRRMDMLYSSIGAKWNGEEDDKELMELAEKKMREFNSEGA